MMESRNVDTLRLLATGFVRAHEAGLVQPGPGLPYNDSLQKAANRITADLLLAGQRPPQHVAELIAWAHRPLSEWPLPLPADATFGQLLADCRPSDVCYTWAVESTVPQWELSLQLIPQMRDECVAHGRPDWYSHFRGQLIQHPILDRRTEARWHMDEIMSQLQTYWTRVYEPVPNHVPFEQELWCCPYCGWTLTRDGAGRWQCDDDLCERIKGELGRKSHRRDAREVTARMRRPFRRFLLLPGVPELSLGAALQALKLPVQFWPDYDRADLRVRFPDGAYWDIDVKDWAVPFRLASEIASAEGRPRGECERFFYVVPDHRERLFPGYERAVRNSISRSGPSVCRTRRLMGMATERMKGGRADAQGN